MEKQCVFAGFGGQGILTAGLIVANIAAEQDREVTWIPSYGSEMRGGTANCTIKISDEPIASPFVKKIDILVVMNKPSLEKFLPQMKSSGLVVMDSSIIKNVAEKEGLQYIKVPATSLCENLKYARGANICMIGALAGCTNLFEKENYEVGISGYFSKNPKFNVQNKSAFEAGYDSVQGGSSYGSE